jgi:hypothetical protein
VGGRMNILTWVNQNILWIAVIIVIGFFLFKYFLWPKLKAWNNLPPEMMSLQSLDSYENIKDK